MKSNYLKIALVSAIVALGQFTATSQSNNAPCGTDQKNEEMMLKNPELRQAYINYVNDINKRVKEKGEKGEKATTTVYTIPMVFHILHVNGAENVSDANVIAQVNRLNTDFRKLNTDITNCPPYFQGIAGDAMIQFKLAQKDPNGNCTNGIERIYSHKTFDAGERSKLNQWPRDKYFNVWVISVLEVDPGSVGLVLAYATFPSSVDGFGYPSDGVIMRSDQVNGTSRTLTHETGHWLGLEHTWGNTEVATVCGDDNVTDTPINKGHFSTCPAYDFTCDNTVLSASYAFSGVTTSTGTTDSTNAPYVADSTMTFSRFTANGVAANSLTSNNFNFNMWDTGAVNGLTSFASLTGTNALGKYYEFTVTPDPNVLMSLTGITFDVMRDATGPRTFEVRSSANSYASNLTSSITPANPNLSVQTGNTFFINFDTATTMTGAKITLSGTSYTGTANSITFRIYGYNAEDTLGSFGIDNVVLTGTFGDAENINNYMDYSSCTYMFTQGQVDRMRATAESPIAARNQLWQTSNLVATGTDGATYPACTPSTDFYASRYYICEGSSVVFTPNVLNASVGAGATTYAWSFPGGSPATSGASSPTVTYANSGIYDVTLTVTSAGNSSTVTKPVFIEVSENYADVPYSYQEGFENATDFYSLWDINDLDQNSKTWWRTNETHYSGSNCIKMNGYYNYEADVDQLVSPQYNCSFLSGVTLNFRLAAATTATTAIDMNDQLQVWSSNDCGATWNSRVIYKGGFGATNPLLNNGYHPEDFVPTAGSSSQWELKTISIPGTVLGPKMRFKFEYTTGWESNNIYIDDINIMGTVGIDESILGTANVSLYPNPANQTATLAYHLEKKGDVKIELVDVLGKKLMDVNHNGQLEGDYTVEISKNDLKLNNGIYFVKMTIDQTAITKKLIISE